MPEKPIQVLLIEDSPSDALIVRDELAEAPGAAFEVTHIERLREAMQRLRDQSFDVALLDLGLADSQGRESFEALHRQAPGLTVVVLTSLTDEALALELIQHGAQDYLVKGHMQDHVLARTLRYALERKRAEVALTEALRTAEHTLDQTRQLLEAAPDGILVVDGQGIMATVNTQAERLFGYSRDEMLGQPIEMLLPKRFRESHVSHRQAYSDSPRIRPMGARLELFGHRKDGAEFPVDVSLSPFTGAERPLFIATVRDITERKKAEQRLRQQLAHLDLLHRITRAISEHQDLNSILQVVLGNLEENLQLDLACVFLYDSVEHELTVKIVGQASHALAERLSLRVATKVAVDENGLGRCIRGELIHEPDLTDAKAPFAQRLVAGGIRSLVIAPLPVESRIFGVLLVARRQPQSFSSVECEFLRQLSEHVALAAQHAELYTALQSAYDDLRQTQQALMQQERLRALGQMASGIAHDINNAISPASLYAESLLEREPGLSKQAREYLVTIQQAIEDVAETVSGMREFYRQREPQLTLRPVELNRMATSVADLTRPRWADMPQKEGYVIELRTDLASELPIIMGIESELRGALTNLILNAVDSMPHGGILTLCTRIDDHGQPDHTFATHVIVEVTDTGVGMDEDTRRRCLEPFFSTKGERGTGLGLAMVYGAIERHSAELEIESEVGRGTTVRLLFPLVQTVEDQPPAAPGEQLPSLRLLVIDDDPMLCRSLRDILTAESHRVTTMDGGQAGIAAFQQAHERGEPFDAVITDLGMPYVDGRAVARNVKKASASTPVIMLTGWGMRMMAKSDVPPHVDRVLSKPPKIRELREALRELIAGRGGKAEGSEGAAPGAK
jgi:PAS domain S-box-containing protein